MATGLGWATDGGSVAQHHVEASSFVKLVVVVSNLPAGSSLKQSVETLYKEDLGH